MVEVEAEAALEGTARLPRSDVLGPYRGRVADLTEPCPNCGTHMRWETSHERCDGCGYIRPCCEGAPCPI